MFQKSRQESRVEVLKAPASFGFSILGPVMQPVISPFPELDDVRHQAKSGPKIGPGHEASVMSMAEASSRWIVIQNNLCHKDGSTLIRVAPLHHFLHTVHHLGVLTNHYCRGDADSNLQTFIFFQLSNEILNYLAIMFLERIKAKLDGCIHFASLVIGMSDARTPPLPNGPAQTPRL
jgi:hypothetical protein